MQKLIDDTGLPPSTEMTTENQNAEAPIMLKVNME